MLLFIYDIRTSLVLCFCCFVFVFDSLFFSLSLKTIVIRFFLVLCVFFHCNSFSRFESIIDKNDRFVVVQFCFVVYHLIDKILPENNNNNNKLWSSTQTNWWNNNNKKNRALKLSSSLSHNQVCTKKWIKFESKFQNSNPKRFEFLNYHWMCLVCVRCDMIWCPFCHCYWIFSCCYYRRRQHQFINLSYMCVCVNLIRISYSVNERSLFV